MRPSAAPRPIAGRVVIPALLAIAAGCQAYDRDRYNRELDAAVDANDVSADTGTDAPRDLGTDASSDGFDVTEASDIVDVPADIIEVGEDASDAQDIPVEAGLDSTSCDDVHAGALFCDGFETSGLGAWLNTVVMSGTAVRTTSMAYRGLGSLRSETTAPSGFAYLVADAFPFTTSGDLYVRGYYYFPSGYLIDGLTFESGIENVAPYASVGMQLYAGGRVGSYASPGSHFVAGLASAVIPRDRWVCLELHITVSATAGAVELFLDGAPAGMESGFATAPAAGFRTLAVGIGYTASTQPSAVVYSDEIVADVTRIGCD